MTGGCRGDRYYCDAGLSVLMFINLETSDFPWSLRATTRNAYMVSGSRLFTVYVLSALPVSATSTLRLDWTAGILDNILYPVMESSLGSSQVSVTEVVVDVTWRPVGAAGGGGFSVLMFINLETSDFPWSLRATTRNAYMVSGSRLFTVYVLSALPVSATSTLRLDWTAGILDNILYPVMESSLGSSQVSVTEVVVDVTWRPVGAAGGGGFSVLMFINLETSDFPWSLRATTRNAYMVSGSRLFTVYVLSALPVSATSTLRLDWTAGILDNILYPVMESSLGSSQVSVTEVVVDVTWRPVGAAGGGGFSVLMFINLETSDFPWSLRATTRNAYMVSGSRLFTVYVLSALPVSATSTLRLDWTAGILDNILYPVMESSLGSSQVSVTEVVVDVTWRPVGAAGGGGFSVLMFINLETSDFPWSLRAHRCRRNA